MKTKPNTYNPFPGVTDVVPVWVNSGICYSRAVYNDEAAARAVGEAVRASGATANGGFMDGMPLGTVHPAQYKGEQCWEVTY